MPNNTETQLQGWTSAPNQRGTSDIIFSCLFTFILCCWTALHTDIPPPGPRWYHKVWDKSICLILSTFAPELVLAKATQERGIIFRFGELRKECSKTSLPPQWTDTHTWYSLMGGFKTQAPATNAKDVFLPPQTIVQLWRSGHIDASCIPREEEINDKSKSDICIKLLAMLQISAFLITVMARFASRLPTSTLEIQTLAFVPIAILIFVTWWDKPFDIGEPTPVSIRDDAGLEMSVCSNLQNIGAWNLSVVPENSTEASVVKYSIFPTASSLKEVIPIGESNLDHSVSFIFLLFGGIHLAAWNFPFVTNAEKLLWRTSGVIVAVILPVAYVVNWCCLIISTKTFRIRFRLDYDLSKKPPIEVKSYPTVRKYVYRVCLSIYVLARCYLLVEGFIGLRALPADCYRTVDWLQYFPFLS
jgi:hypothetical protein